MKADKRKTLEGKGWAFGNAKDFLGLKSDEDVRIELRLKLAERLRVPRQKRA
jgi:hypothetical protein